MSHSAIAIGGGGCREARLVRDVELLDQTMYGLRIIELVITKECNYRGAMWNEVSRNPH